MKNRKLHRIVAALLVCMMLVSMIPAISAEGTLTLGSPLPIVSAECASSHSHWDISYLTNGNYGSDFWSSGDGVPEQVDIVLTLEKASNVGSLILYPRQQGIASGGARNFPKNFEILTSADGSSWTSVLTKTDYATDETSAPQFFTFDTQQNVKYVKLTINRGGAYVQIAEAVVCAGAVASADGDDNTVATEISMAGAEVDKSEEIGGWAATRVIDGDTTTGWSTGGPVSDPTEEEYIQVKLAEPATLNRLDLYPRYDAANLYGMFASTGQKGPLAFPVDFDILVSSDGQSWTTALEVRDHAVTAQEYQTFTFAEQENVSYIKVVSKRMNYEGGFSYRFQLMEMKAYHVTEKTPTPDPVTYLFEDDFSGDMSKWANSRTNGGVINVTDGQAVATGVAQFSPADETMITTGDLEINVELKPVANWAGIQFNLASTGTDNWSTTGYLLYVKPNGTVELIAGGPQKTLASVSLGSNFDENSMTKMKVVYKAEESKIYAYFNDSEEAAITADLPALAASLGATTYTEGYFGLASGGSGNIFDNFAVVGTKKTAAPVEPTKLTTVSVVGQNVENHSDDYKADKLLDGTVTDSNCWCTKTGTTEAYLTFDLGGTATMDSIKVTARPIEAAYVRNIKDYAIYISDTAPTYSSTPDGTAPTGLPTTAAAEGTMSLATTATPYSVIELPENVEGRYLTVHIKNVYGEGSHAVLNISETEFYATAFEAAPPADDDDEGGETEAVKLDISDATFTSSTHLDGHSTLSGTPIDGSLTTGWTSNPGTADATQEEWCQIKLTAPVTLSRLDLYPRYDTANIYPGTTGPLAFPEDFDILVSSDGTNWTTAKSVTGHTVTAKEYQTFSFDAQENVRYIKLVSKKMSCEGTAGSYRFQLMEMEAYGKAAQSAERTEVSLTGGNVTVSSQINGNATWAPANAIDGNTSLGWSSDGPRTTADYNEWIQVELPTASKISEVVLVPRYGHGNDNVDQFLCFPQDFTIQVSEDGTNWDTVVAKTGYSATKQAGESFTFHPKSNVKYIKVDATKLNHEGNKGYSSFRFQLMEMKAFYTPVSLEELAASITDLSVDEVTEKLVLPEYDDLTVTIKSSSDSDVIDTDGNVDMVNGGTTNIVLEISDGTKSVETAPITVTVTGLKEKLVDKADIASVTATSGHEAWPADHLINGNTQSGFWSTGDGASEQVEIVLTLEEASEVTGVTMYPRVSPKDNSGATFFPENFEIFVSANGEDYTSVVKKENYQHNNSTDPQTFIFDSVEDVTHVKIVINRGGKYAQLAEVEVLTVAVLQTAAEAAEELTAEQADKRLLIDNISEQFRVEITNAEPAGIVNADRTITLPAQDTEVTLTFKVTNRLDETDTATVTRKVLVKSQASLDVQEVADTVDLIPCPANDATQITYPAVPAGYSISIAESSHPTVVDLDGKITRSDDTTYGVRLTFKITNDSTGGSAITKDLLVPIYKTFVAPTMTQAEIDAAHEAYNDYSYGVFVHYISDYSGGASVYADGTRVQTVDEAANAFDAEAFAKSMDELGVDYVMLTLWHGDARPLFPSMTSQRWRDDRRAEDSTTKKSYSDRDVIADLLDALEPYDIDLHLYTHPTDGHDFTAEDQKLTGHADSTGNYATWNQYVNELYYEVCERYGTRIKGLWFDGVYGRTSGAANQARLRETCLTFNPGMILTMNTGFTEGNLNPAPGYTHPDYRAWEVNRYVDFVNDMKFSRYQSAIVLASKGWWTTVGKNATFNVQPAEDVFKYIVAMSSISTHGGFAASTGFYPVHEGEVLDDYFMPGIYDMLLKVNNSYLDPVSESIRGTKNSKAYPTTENLTVSELEWGVANESKDGRYVYLHVLNTPSGDTLTLPATADGTVLRSDAVIMNFDGTTTPVTIEKNATGYSITLPEGVEWSDVDTVIKAERTSVTGVALNKSDITLEAGKTETLVATVDPETAYDNTVIWTTSDKNVATVDETGKVTAVGKGEATITATTADAGKTATCTVTVTLDTTAIDTVVAAANTAKTGVEESDKSADQVAKDTKFVTAAEMKALTDAIAAAEAAKASAKTPAEVTAAAKALNDAVDTFNKAIKTGTYVAKVETKVQIVEGGIKEVPDTLKAAGLDTPAKVNEALVKALITASGTVEDGNVAHYDVTFMVTEDGGATWTKAGEEHFPASGKIQVTLPYPKGTDKTYTFTVVHMFTSTAFGKTPGSVETPSVTNTDDGIRFEVTGLSPISVSWKTPGYDCTVSGHKLTKVPAKAATTTAAGNIEHYICAECDKYFSDAAGKNEITKESVVVPKLTPESNTPVTGDSFPMVLFGTLMLISLFGIAFILLWSKRSFTGKHVK